MNDQLEQDLGSNSYNPDSDGDGIPDGTEVYTMGTSPTSTDSNGDGFTDYNQFYGNYTIDTTTLGDGVTPYDFDGDGIDDPNDPDPLTSQNLSDSDADGVPDGGDSHPSVAWLWSDWNNNGYNDDAEPSPTGEPSVSDSDADGVTDEQDSHPSDYWLFDDWNYNGSNDYTEDWDGDGAANDVDTHMNNNTLWCDHNGNGVNDDQEAGLGDQDGDGVDDGSDSHPFNGSLQSDWDNSGSNDGSPTTQDSDGDGDGTPDQLDSHTGDPQLWSDWNNNGHNDHTETADSDGDGTPDVLDPWPSDSSNGTQTSTEPAPTDSDLDGIPDSSDSHPADASLWDDWNHDGVGDDWPFADTDEDGTANGQDSHPDHPELWEDFDGDGVNDSQQFILMDTDGDGYGDELDTHPNEPSIWNDHDGDGFNDELNAPVDSDHDGLPDTIDTLPGDFDNDGLTDIEEMGVGSDPALSDSDADGISDSEESIVGTSPSNVDTDSDGLTDAEEVLTYFTDPLVITPLSDPAANENGGITAGQSAYENMSPDLQQGDSGTSNTSVAPPLQENTSVSGTNPPLDVSSTLFVDTTTSTGTGIPMSEPGTAGGSDLTAGTDLATTGGVDGPISPITTTPTTPTTLTSNTSTSNLLSNPPATTSPLGPVAAAPLPLLGLPSYLQPQPSSLSFLLPTNSVLLQSPVVPDVVVNPLSSAQAASRIWARKGADYTAYRNHFADLTDSDSDEIPDRVEVLYTPLLVTATGDLDGDGISNLEEYNQGTALDGVMDVHDFDGDGISNTDELAYNRKHPGLFNPYRFDDAAKDDDGDGLLNVEELSGKRDGKTPRIAYPINPSRSDPGQYSTPRTLSGKLHYLAISDGQLWAVCDAFVQENPSATRRPADFWTACDVSGVEPKPPAMTLGPPPTQTVNSLPYQLTGHFGVVPKGYVDYSNRLPHPVVHLWLQGSSVSSTPPTGLFNFFMRYLPHPVVSPAPDDLDGDGIPNSWEHYYGLKFRDASDGGTAQGLVPFAPPPGPKPVAADFAGYTTAYNAARAAWNGYKRSEVQTAKMDPDFDQLPNLQEYRHRTHPRIGDSDGDGAGDGAEVSFGTRPSQASSRPWSNFALGEGGMMDEYRWYEGRKVVVALASESTVQWGLPGHWLRIPYRFQLKTLTGQPFADAPATVTATKGAALFSVLQGDYAAAKPVLNLVTDKNGWATFYGMLPADCQPSSVAGVLAAVQGQISVRSGLQVHGASFLIYPSLHLEPLTEGLLFWGRPDIGVSLDARSRISRWQSLLTQEAFVVADTLSPPVLESDVGGRTWIKMTNKDVLALERTAYSKNYSAFAAVRPAAAVSGQKCVLFEGLYQPAAGFNSAQSLTDGGYVQVTATPSASASGLIYPPLPDWRTGLVGMTPDALASPLRYQALGYRMQILPNQSAAGVPSTSAHRVVGLVSDANKLKHFDFGLSSPSTFNDPTRRIELPESYDVRGPMALGGLHIKDSSFMGSVGDVLLYDRPLSQQKFVGPTTYINEIFHSQAVLSHALRPACPPVPNAGSLPDGVVPNWYILAALGTTGTESILALHDSDAFNLSREYREGTHPRLSDSDGDGLSDSAELNATPPTNPRYWDTDFDLIPDATDDAPATPATADFSTLTQNATSSGTQAATSTATTDSDGDGLPDMAEVLHYKTNPLLKDTDGDLLEDGWEVANGRNPLVKDGRTTSGDVADSDGDGVADAWELLAGTNPSDVADAPYWVKASVVQPGDAAVPFNSPLHLIMNRTVDANVKTSPPNTQVTTADGDVRTWNESMLMDITTSPGVPKRLNVAQANDQIWLQPSLYLQPGHRYRLTITQATLGIPVVPHSIEFTAGVLHSPDAPQPTPGQFTDDYGNTIEFTRNASGPDNGGIAPVAPDFLNSVKSGQLDVMSSDVYVVSEGTGTNGSPGLVYEASSTIAGGPRPLRPPYFAEDDILPGTDFDRLFNGVVRGVWTADSPLWQQTGQRMTDVDPEELDYRDLRVAVSTNLFWKSVKDQNSFDARPGPTVRPLPNKDAFAWSRYRRLCEWAGISAATRTATGLIRSLRFSKLIDELAEEFHLDGVGKWMEFTYARWYVTFLEQGETKSVYTKLKLRSAVRSDQQRTYKFTHHLYGYDRTSLPDKPGLISGFDDPQSFTSTFNGIRNPQPFASFTYTFVIPPGAQESNECTMDWAQTEDSDFVQVQLHQGRNAAIKKVNTVVGPPVGALAVDANRDGTITKGETSTKELPFRFWINNDDDPANYHDDVEIAEKEDEPAVPEIMDWWSAPALGGIDGVRDLEDFTRLHLTVPADAVAWCRAGSARIGFKWLDATGQEGVSSGPRIRIYKAASPTGDAEHLFYSEKAAAQVDDEHRLAIADVHGSETEYLDGAYWNSVATGTTMLPFIFEGGTKGSGRLVAVIKYQSLPESELGGVWIKLLDVQEMFERSKVKGKMSEPDGVPDPWVTTEPVTFEATEDPNGNPPDRDPEETKEYIIHVHGWRMTYNEAQTWANTTYKRLWQLGYKGRYGFFSWPTYSPATSQAEGFLTYNPSEYRAWLSGDALKAYVSSLPEDYTKYMMAHSMGNVVVGSAYRRGMKGISRYTMLNAAVAAQCYNPALESEENISTPDDDDDASIREKFGLSGKFSGIDARITNFFLEDDFATGLWKVNHVSNKPNIMFGPVYGYSNGLPKLIRWDEKPLRMVEVTMVEEAMAYITKAKSPPAGRTPSNLGLARAEQVDLNSYNFEYDFPLRWMGSVHSAQWLWSLQRSRSFWLDLMESFDKTPNFP